MRPRLRRFLLGVAAGAIALGVSYVIRYLFGGLFLPEVAVNALVTQTPGTVESSLVTNLQSLAKYSAFAGAIAMNLVLYGLLGYFMIGAATRKIFSHRTSLYSLVAYLVTLGLSLLFLSLAQVLSAPQPLPMVVLSVLPPQVAFGLVLTAGDRFARAPPPGVICKPLPKPEGGFSRKRRLIVQAGLATAVAGVLLYYGVDLLFQKPNTAIGAGPQADVTSMLAQQVTANDKFYRVDVNIFPPKVDSNGWNLQVSGLVGNPLSLTYNQLSGLSSVEQYNTLECVSNKTGGDLISTAKWTGVKLKELLQMAQVRQEATYVVFKCSDGYDVGIPMDRALLDGTILAYQMNGVALPQEHGFPVRMIVPGFYGMMNAKWVTSIELVKEVYKGYWQQRGWANEAAYQTGSSIVVPGASEVDLRFGIDGKSQLPPGMIPIAGLAFAGDRGIEKVEVSTDGGSTWMPASLKDPISGNTWVMWTAEWNPPRTGAFILSVRATDKTGAVQTATMADPFPKGATGYHIIEILVKKPQTTQNSS